MNLKLIKFCNLAPVVDIDNNLKTFKDRTQGRDVDEIVKMPKFFKVVLTII